MFNVLPSRRWSRIILLSSIRRLLCVPLPDSILSILRIPVKVGGRQHLSRRHIAVKYPPLYLLCPLFYPVHAFHFRFGTVFSSVHGYAVKEQCKIPFNYARRFRKAATETFALSRSFALACSDTSPFTYVHQENRSRSSCSAGKLSDSYRTQRKQMPFVILHKVLTKRPCMHIFLRIQAKNPLLPTVAGLILQDTRHPILVNTKAKAPGSPNPFRRCVTFQNFQF